jgi:hypothetical protein
MDLNEYNQYLTRKLAHYNKWLLDDTREFTEPYPGFPEDVKLAKKGKKVESPVIGNMAQVLSGTAKAAPKRAARQAPQGPKAGTKSQLAVDIYKRFSGDKAQTIAAIQDELQMSLAGATTYFYNAKKAAR